MSWDEHFAFTKRWRERDPFPKNQVLNQVVRYWDFDKDKINGVNIKVEEVGVEEFHKIIK